MMVIVALIIWFTLNNDKLVYTPNSGYVSTLSHR